MTQFLRSQFLRSLTSCALGALLFAGCGGSDSSSAAKMAKSPDGFFKAVESAAKEKNPELIWGTLPPSYKKDLNGLVVAFAEKMPADVYDKAIGLVGKLGTLLEQNGNLLVDSLMSNPMAMMAMQNMPEAERPKADEVKSMMNSLGKVCSSFAKSDFNSVEKLKKFDGEKFLSSFGKDLMALMDEGAKAAGASATGDMNDFQEFLNNPSIATKVIKEEADSATVEVTMDGKTEKVEMVKVEDVWVLKELAADWSREMEKARKNIAELDTAMDPKNKMQAMTGMSMVDSTLDQMIEAKTKEEMNQVIQGLMGMVMGGMMGGGGGNPPGF